MGKSGLQPGRGLIQRGRESLHARQIWRWQWVYSLPTDSSSDILEFICCSTFSRPLVGPPHGYISLTVQTETAVNRDRVGRKRGVCLLWHATAVGMCAVFLPSASEGVFIYWATGYGGDWDWFVYVAPHLQENSWRPPEFLPDSLTPMRQRWTASVSPSTAQAH